MRVLASGARRRPAGLTDPQAPRWASISNSSPSRLRRRRENECNNTRPLHIFHNQALPLADGASCAPKIRSTESINDHQRHEPFFYFTSLHLVFFCRRDPAIQVFSCCRLLFCLLLLYRCRRRDATISLMKVYTPEFGRSLCFCCLFKFMKIRIIDVLRKAFFRDSFFFNSFFIASPLWYNWKGELFISPIWVGWYPNWIPKILLLFWFPLSWRGQFDKEHFRCAGVIQN